MIQIPEGVCRPEPRRWREDVNQDSTCRACNAGEFEKHAPWCWRAGAPAQPDAPTPLDALFGAIPDLPLEPAAPEPSAGLPKWHVDSACSAQEWESAARSVGITGPGAMQQAKHMADAAVKALNRVGSSLSYEDTSPQDITDGILLRCNGNPINCDVAHDFAERADGLLKAAESQLEAVRESIDSGLVPAAIVARIRSLLTPTPSPGAGCGFGRCGTVTECADCGRGPDHGPRPGAGEKP